MRYSMEDFHRQVRSFVFHFPFLLMISLTSMLPRLAYSWLPRQKSVAESYGMLQGFHLRRLKVRTSTRFQRTAMYEKSAQFLDSLTPVQKTGRWCMAVSHLNYWRTFARGFVFWLCSRQPTRRTVGPVWITWDENGTSGVRLEYIPWLVSNNNTHSQAIVWSENSLDIGHLYAFCTTQDWLQ